jgi:tripartite-type tricarboxylate transporter receptor subunit TctC
VTRSRTRWHACLTTCLVTFATALASAQAPAFPDRAIVIIDPASAGSGTDYFSRPLAEEMGKILGISVIVENKPGAGGALAAEFVARSKPDGYTLGLAAVSTHAANPSVNRSIRYDPVRDFAAITTMVTLPSVMVVRADSPIRSLKDLVDSAKEAPGTLSFGGPGIGTAAHVLMEQFSRLAGIRLTYIPYRGSPEMLADLLGGRIDVVSDNIPSMLPFLKDGRLRALVVRDVNRAVVLPSVATFKELGYDAVSFPLWFGLVAPSGTPPNVVRFLNETAQKAMRAPAFQQRVEAGAARYSPSTPEQFQTQIQEWYERFKLTVQEANIRIE